MNIQYSDCHLSIATIVSPDLSGGVGIDCTCAAAGDRLESGSTEDVRHASPYC